VASIGVLTEGVRDVVDAFVEDIGRAPGLVELLEILYDGARTLPDDALADAHPDEIVGYTERPRVRSRDTDAVGDLNDGAYVAASGAFNRWWQAGPGTPVTAADLGTAVLDALRLAGPVLLGGQDATHLTAIAPKLRRARARARVGDVIAVPTSDHDYHLVVLVCRNRFATAFGLFHGRYPLRTPPVDLAARATAAVRYSSEDAIATRRWRIVSHDEHLLAIFPADPEIYHAPQPPFPGLPRIGEFGAAETADGQLRDLTSAEARTIDLGGSYQQYYEQGQFERALPELLARHSR
jgi:hypothetical protein